ncbi:hypothetical protein KIP88_14835 [Bradyrhizobium sp. SRL28]|uniref:DUF6011 domain-containing protein n=1 Tax=Bradyrhizobium sp. SRL28 TaxID=2836178 RepID=UPI001BDEEA3D|nr:DUF6011 domain-containing protein [Bradyrhizobium sp. SRL28]MBT1511785.1 hypothetical protein [Bradyrhizobium sp. SRL28]
MTIKIMIAAIPKLAELREVVLAHSEKRKPKWGFRIAVDIVMELQAQPCLLLSERLKAGGGKQAVLSFEGYAVMTPGAASAVDLKKRPPGSRSRKFSLLQFDGEPNWQLALGQRSWPYGSDVDSVAPLDDAILAALQVDGIFTQLTPERMLKPACMICGKALTDPASMSRWIGPECAATTSIRIFREKTDRRPISAYSIEEANA